MKKHFEVVKLKRFNPLRNKVLTDLATDDLVKLCLARQWIEQKTCAEEDNDDESEADKSDENEDE